MLNNYLRIAFRNLSRNKLYSVINIGCLAIGIAVSLTIMLYVLHEHSYDRFHANAKRLFSITGTLKMGNSSFNVNQFSYSTGPQVQKADPRVENYMRINKPYVKVNLQTQGQKAVVFSENQNFLFADSHFFDFFSFGLVRGKSDKVLSRPNTVVLSQRAARKYFGDGDPIGKVIRYNSEFDLEVTGIAANPPSNSSISFDFVASLTSIMSMDMPLAANSPRVQGGPFLTWLLLKDPAASPKVERTLSELSRMPGSKDPGDVYKLTALPDVHLHMNFGDFSNTRYLGIFPMVAGLILLLALVNYMSLATARAATRAKEVGVRKVMGAGRSWIAGQFYTESALYAILSFAVGMGLFFLFRGPFLNLLQLQIDDSFLLNPGVLLSFTGLLLFVILAAGSYPSLVLSRLNPVAVLYGRLSRRRGGERVRKVFTVLQFTISMSLIICSIVIGKQLYHLRHVDTGVDRDNVVMIPFSKTMLRYEAFKHAVGAVSGVHEVATAEYPMYKGYNAYPASIPGSDRTIGLNALLVDKDFTSLLGLRWREKPVSPADLYDGRHIVINEAAIGKLDLPADPVGHSVTVINKAYVISGVLKDFNYQSLHQEIGPLCLFINKDTINTMGGGVHGCLFARIQAHTNVPTVVDAIKKIYGQYDQQTVFEFQFMDEGFDSQYKAEDRLAALFDLFTGITIVIACLGLFALATFAAEQRIREIGIRKVLGASAASISRLLSVDFLRPVLIAVLMASPLSWWAMHKWLEDFAYKTAFSWWIFFVAAVLLLGIALVTILFRSLRAARANPVDNLRTE
ncbi:MAG TPA: ABC transporter permease [Puia sp.]|jgi:putative ABC transport system permease protein|nr:ABC transporter permease [Puia sp.]